MSFRTFLGCLRAGASAAWLALIRYANWFAGILTAGAITLNATHPEVITAVEDTLSPWLRAAALFAWCAFIEFLVQRTKTGANPP